MSTDQIIAALKSLANPEKAAFKAKKFAIPASNALGIYLSDLNSMAKEIGKDSETAIELMRQPIYEGKLLASKIYDPNELNMDLVTEWVDQFDTWEICDAFSMTVFARSPLASDIIHRYSKDTKEMRKRTSFATLAGLCSHDKKSDNEYFQNYFSLLSNAASDNRNFVKKAVSWAARSIGKRNEDLRLKVIEWAKQLDKGSSAQWIAKDVLNELEGSKLRISNYPRNKYGKPKRNR